jgi:hypothetical protein
MIPPGLILVTKLMEVRITPSHAMSALVVIKGKHNADLDCCPDTGAGASLIR